MPQALAEQLHQTKQAGLQQMRWQAARRVQQFRTKQREDEQARLESLAYVEHASIKHPIPQFAQGAGGPDPPTPTLQSPGFVMVEPPPANWALYSRPALPTFTNGFSLLLHGITSSIRWV